VDDSGLCIFVDGQGRWQGRVVVVVAAVAVVMLVLSHVLVCCVHLTVIAQRINTPPIDYRHVLVRGYEMAIV
jgi:hypothetical protein